MQEEKPLMLTDPRLDIQEKPKYLLLTSVIDPFPGQKGKGREGKGREGKGREGKGRGLLSKPFLLNKAWPQHLHTLLRVSLDSCDVGVFSQAGPLHGLV